MDSRKFGIVFIDCRQISSAVSTFWISTAKSAWRLVSHDLDAVEDRRRKRRFPGVRFESVPDNWFKAEVSFACLHCRRRSSEVWIANASGQNPRAVFAPFIEQQT
jgi:hypothetical protein